MYTKLCLFLVKLDLFIFELDLTSQFANATFELTLFILSFHFLLPHLFDLLLKWSDSCFDDLGALLSLHTELVFDLHELLFVFASQGVLLLPKVTSFVDQHSIVMATDLADQLACLAMGLLKFVDSGSLTDQSVVELAYLGSELG